MHTYLEVNTIEIRQLILSEQVVLQVMLLLLLKDFF